jgi:hypothetical protein
MVTDEPVASTSFFSLFRSSGVMVTFSPCLGFSPLEVQNNLRSRALPPKRSAGDPSVFSCSSRLDCAGSRRGSARSVASNETPTLSAVSREPSRSAVAVTTASSPETAPANDCSNSVGVGLGSGDWLEDDDSSESNHEHPDRTRASATTPPWILLLRFTPITLPCPRGINNFHSPFRDASRPRHPPHHDSHPVRIPARRGTRPAAMAS